MARLSISTAWNEAAAFAGREARLLFPVSFLLLVLPGVVFQAATGTLQTSGMLRPSPWLLLAFLPISLISIIGSLALCRLALRPGTSVGEALRAGLGRLLPVFGASLLLVLALFVALIPLVVILGLDPDNPQPGRIMLLALLMIVGGAYFGGRLLLMTPSASVEATGPVAMIRRSWTLTAPVALKLFGLMLLLLLVYVLVILAVSIIGGIVIVLAAGPPQPGSTAGLLVLILNGLVQAVIWVYFFSFTSRLYAQLAGPGPAGVFS